MVLVTGKRTLTAFKNGCKSTILKLVVIIREQALQNLWSVEVRREAQETIALLRR
jgi:hypothetical protein